MDLWDVKLEARLGGDRAHWAGAGRGELRTWEKMSEKVKEIERWGERKSDRTCQWVYLGSVGGGRFCLRRSSVAAAHVGSCTSSASCFKRLAEGDDTGGAVGLLAGVYFVTVDVEGDGSKPANRDKGTLRSIWMLQCYVTHLAGLLFLCCLEKPVAPLAAYRKQYVSSNPYIRRSIQHFPQSLLYIVFLSVRHDLFGC